MCWQWFKTSTAQHKKSKVMMAFLSSTKRGQNQETEMNMWPLGSLISQRHHYQKRLISIWVPYRSSGNTKPFLNVNFVVYDAWIFRWGLCWEMGGSNGKGLLNSAKNRRPISFFNTFWSCVDRQISSHTIPGFEFWFQHMCKIDFTCKYYTRLSYFLCFPTVSASLFSALSPC